MKDKHTPTVSCNRDFLSHSRVFQWSVCKKVGASPLLILLAPRNRILLFKLEIKLEIIENGRNDAHTTLTVEHSQHWCLYHAEQMTCFNSKIDCSEILDAVMIKYMSHSLWKILILLIISFYYCFTCDQMLMKKKNIFFWKSCVSKNPFFRF